MAAIVPATFVNTGFAEEANVADNAQSATPAPSFYVGEYRVKGNTILKPVSIELALTPFLGDNKTVEDVEAARQALELRYRDAGYPTVLVNIPEQDVVDGVVYLEVVEGRVDELLVTGSRYFSLDRIKKKVPALAEGNVPYIPAVQEQLANVNQATRDLQVTPVLRPGRTPGTLEVELKVKDQSPLHGSIDLNNRYFRDTTKLRAGASLQYDNLWQREHSFSMSYQTSPEDTDEVQVISGTYLWNFQDSDNLLVLYGVASDSDVASVGTINVIGNGVIAGARLVLPLLPTPGYFHSMTLGLDYKDFEENVFLVEGDKIETPIEYINWALLYNGTVRNQFGSTGFGVGINFGIRDLVNSREDFEDKRFNAKPNYFYARGDFVFDYRIFFRSKLMARFGWQLADSPLPSNEQFSVGGATTVRGYYESQLLGDDGISGSLEWYTPNLAHNKAQQVNDFRLLMFLDGAYVTLNDPLPGQDKQSEIAGTGVGLRMTMFKNLIFEFDYAYPLKDSLDVKKGEERVHALIEYSF